MRNLVGVTIVQRLGFGIVSAACSQMFRERNHTKRGGWGENGKVNEAKYQQLVNLGKEYVLGSSLDIFATFLHI